MSLEAPQQSRFKQVVRYGRVLANLVGDQPKLEAVLQATEPEITLFIGASVLPSILEKVAEPYQAPHGLIAFLIGIYSPQDALEMRRVYPRIERVFLDPVLTREHNYFLRKYMQFLEPYSLNRLLLDQADSYSDQFSELNIRDQELNRSMASLAAPSFQGGAAREIRKAYDSLVKAQTTTRMLESDFKFGDRTHDSSTVKPHEEDIKAASLQLVLIGNALQPV